ncbi:Helix-turn-helix [Ruminococcaceae bacterium YAD3003]|nr:Helix-turn-helix [Ruminococcaceae bacterium YAD3003]
MNSFYEEKITPPTKETVGNRIQSRRKERYELYLQHEGENNNPYKRFAFCKDQGTFAKKVGVSRKAIVCWENGDTFPAIDNLVIICELLESNLEYFVGFFDCDGFSPIALCHHFSKIDKDILETAKSDGDYLDFLNFFMKPENIKPLVNETTLNGWRKFKADLAISTIEEPLKTMIKEAYEKYDAFNLYNEQSNKTYKAYLKTHISKDTLKASMIKKSLPAKDALQFIKNGRVINYDKFIDYIADATYSSLRNYAILERNKEKLGQQFAELFTKYISQYDN